MSLKRIDISNVPVPKGSRAVPLTRNKYALVDEDDYEKVMEYNWSISNGYARTTIDGKAVGMHRFILGVTSSKIFVDHEFHNTLDNRKSQLRVCNPSQNNMNRKSRQGSSSVYKGVYRFKKSKKWLSSLNKSGKSIYLGSFISEEDAAKAYDEKAKELFGEFAYLNFK